MKNWSKILIGVLLIAIIVIQVDTWRIRHEIKSYDRAIDTVYTGTTANDGTGATLLQFAQTFNDLVNLCDSLGLDDLVAQDLTNLQNLIDSLNQMRQAINDSLEARLDSADVALSLTTYQANVGNYFFRELQSWGLSIIGLPVGAAQPMTTNKTLADGTACWQSFYLPVGDTITGVRFIQRTQGGYTAADSNCVALYSVSGATYTRVAVSANNGDLWKGTGYSLQTVAFTSPYVAAAGNYMVFFVYNQSAETTAPNIYCWNGSVGVSQLLTGTNAHRLSGTVSSEGGPPTTEVAGDLTASDVIYGIWLY